METGFVGEKVSDRLLNTDEEVFKENSRIYFWTNGWEWYSQNVLGTGAGVSNEARMFSSEIGIYKEAHSVFFSILIQLNVIGLILLIIALLLILKEIIKIEEKHLKFTASFLFIFFIIQASKGSSFQTRLFWHPVTLVLLIIEVGKYNSYLLKYKIRDKNIASKNEVKDLTKPAPENSGIEHF